MKKVNEKRSIKLRRFTLTPGTKPPLCQDLDTRYIVHTGLLVKSPPQTSYLRKSWRKRYFVLYDMTVDRTRKSESSAIDEDGKFLIYYKKRVDENWINKIPLDGATVSENPKPVNGYQYVIDLQTTERKFYLCADNSTDHKSWLNVLRSTLEQSEVNRSNARRDSIEDFLQLSNTSTEENVRGDDRLQQKLDKLKRERVATASSPNSSPDLQFNKEFCSGDKTDSGISEPIEEEDYMCPPPIKGQFQDMSLRDNQSSGYNSKNDIHKPIGPSHHGYINFNRKEIPQAIISQVEHGYVNTDRNSRPCLTSNTHLSPRLRRSQDNYDRYIVASEEIYGFEEMNDTPSVKDNDFKDIYDIPPAKDNDFGDVYDFPPAKYNDFGVIYDIPPAKDNDFDDVYDFPPAKDNDFGDVYYTPIAKNNDFGDVYDIPQGKDNNFGDVYDIPPAKDNGFGHVHYIPPTKDNDISDVYNILQAKNNDFGDVYDIPPAEDSDCVYDTPPAKNKKSIRQNYSSVQDKNNNGDDAFRTLNSNVSLTKADVYSVPSNVTFYDQRGESLPPVPKRGDQNIAYDFLQISCSNKGTETKITNYPIFANGYSLLDSRETSTKSRNSSDRFLDRPAQPSRKLKPEQVPNVPPRTTSNRTTTTNPERSKKRNHSQFPDKSLPAHLSLDYHIADNDICYQEMDPEHDKTNLCSSITSVEGNTDVGYQEKSSLPNKDQLKLPIDNTNKLIEVEEPYQPMRPVSANLENPRSFVAQERQRSPSSLGKVFKSPNYRT
ncbi:GRB2-associated-binding protein 1-like isoform X2 [Hydractinia symbiolongicarpus]|uniref:GRB2-associated-binding protein 1-like isoform X2 n=1 Tax=Hydractinia symbiolongicarpus TaxID=13093 RepID=UPI00254AEA67|nr:GRB2-associated-binding protein 1-like isoform X2 [Hydractinia symbiolongicarpus]